MRKYLNSLYHYDFFDFWHAFHYKSYSLKTIQFQGYSHSRPRNFVSCNSGQHTNPSSFQHHTYQLGSVLWEVTFSYLSVIANLLDVIQQFFERFGFALEHSNLAL